MKDINNLVFKRQIIDEDTIRRTLMRLSYEIIEKNPNLSNIVLIGIKRRGIPLASIIHDNILKQTGINIEIGSLDIKYYRDDLKKVDSNPLVKNEVLNVDVNNKSVIVIDDVLFTGRTVRAAIDALFDVGRPSKISLLVLIDRGHRELPIKADYVGKNIPTSLNEVISVNIPPIDEKTNVEIWEIKND